MIESRPQRIAPPLLLTLVGALSLILFSMIQKKLMGVDITLQPRALVIPVLFGGTSGYLLGLWRERLRESARKLEQSEERYRTIVEFSSDFIYWRTPDGALRYVAPTSTLVTGYTPAEFYAQPSLLDTIVHPDDRSLWNQHVCRDAPTPQTSSRRELRIITKEGETRWISHVCRPIRGTDGSLLGIRGSHSDITETKTLTGKISHLENHDLLTGLLNRTIFQDRLEQLIGQCQREGTPLFVFTVGLDRFKLVNDSLGHAIGDDILRLAAERLLVLFRHDDTVCRLGGDVFAVLARSQRKADAVLIAQKALSAFSEPFTGTDGPLHVTASIGIAVFPDDGITPLNLVNNSEAAMFRAKEQGRNTHRFYAAEMNAQASQHLRMLGLMHAGLEQGEFFLHYQPQICLSTGLITGVEALLRWENPELGSVPPGTFIPLAEESGLIHRLGALALKEGCNQCRRWHEAGHALRLAVNVSGYQFLQSDFMERLREVLAETGFPPAALELELTESILMRDPDENALRLQRLKGLGLRLAIDDFGTGYSSLSRLQQLPIDRLKIDRSFIHDIGIPPDGRAIPEAIIALAKSLGLSVVAEGVETAEQLAFISSKGCDEAQGFLYSRPVSADQFTSLLLRPPFPLEASLQ
jgi:diguanylate cyclase (GGDEF)-like protein/PAS domain S-box-containing protein